MFTTTTTTPTTVTTTTTTTGDGFPQSPSGILLVSLPSQRSPYTQTYLHVILAHRLKKCDMCNICKALHADVTPYVFI